MNNSKLKGREVRLKKEIMQIIGERDESIRQAFSEIDNHLRQAFGTVEFKLNIIFSALEEMGMPADKINEIGQKLQQAMQQQQAQPQSGGDINEPYSGTAPTESVENPEQPADDTSEEQGSEHFG